jgi:hypothetical protein
MSLFRTVAAIGAATATLVLAPSAALANNQVDWKKCDNLTHHGYEALRIHEKNLGCYFAHRWVRRIINHGPETIDGVHCSVTYQSGLFGSSAGHHNCRGHVRPSDPHAPVVAVALRFDLFVAGGPFAQR